MSRILAGFAAGVGPLAWSVAAVAYCIGVNQWILNDSARSMFPAMLLALPPLAVEILLTRAFEARTRGWTVAVRLGLAARVGFLLLLAFLFIWLPLAVRSSASAQFATDTHWVTQDLSNSHLFLRIVWLANPWPALLLGSACLMVYAACTVRARRARGITTVGLPALATFALFLLMYQFPDAAVRSWGRSRPAFVTTVWPRTEPDHRFPREVVVTADERHAIATFGSTFPIDRSSPPPDDLAFGASCGSSQHAGDCRRNLALIDLATGTTRTWAMTVARRFVSESEERFFIAPWNLYSLVELHTDGAAKTHPLPREIAGGPFREVDLTYYAADSGRVYMVNGNNPVVVAWDVRTAQIAEVLNLAGSYGIELGDTTIALTRSRSRRRLYVSVKSDPHMVVEVDEDGLKPLRAIRPSPVAYDIEMTPDERSLYLSGFFTGHVWRYNADSLELEATFDTPLHCRRVGFSPDGSQLFAASYVTGELAVFDTRTTREIGSFWVAPRLEGLHVAGDGLYLLSAAGLFRIPLSTLKQLNRAPDGGRSAATPPWLRVSWGFARQLE